MVLRDWHTALGGKRSDATLSTRYYLNDAAFLVGLEGEEGALLQEMQEALRHPCWNLFLGRKSCPPSVTPYLKDGLQDEALDQVLRHHPWLGVNQRQYAKLTQVRVVLDDPDGAEVRRDWPVSFAERTFYTRRVRTDFIPPPPFWQLMENSDPEKMEESPCIFRV
jgi:CRISPR system Cascade subunit CasD